MENRASRKLCKGEENAKPQDSERRKKPTHTNARDRTEDEEEEEDKARD
jgi:hypothetical protein